MNNSSCVFEIIHNTVQQSGNSLSVKELCSIAGVSRSGYYAWIRAAPARELQEQKDCRDFDLVLTAYKMHGYTKGARGIHMALLQREFECYGPKMVLLTDITYLPYNGTFTYLSTILDAFTNQILSYVLSDSLEVDFVLETMNKLIETHGISLHAKTIVHSNQGCHYTNHSFINILYDKKLRQSMSRRSCCWDNAPQESFFEHMKDHIKSDLAGCTSYTEVQSVIDAYMNYYNGQRYQWHLAKLAPDEFYKFIITGEYPLDIPNKPALPTIARKPEELGSRAEQNNTNRQ